MMMQLDHTKPWRGGGDLSRALSKAGIENYYTEDMGTSLKIESHGISMPQSSTRSTYIHFAAPFGTSGMAIVATSHASSGTATLIIDLVIAPVHCLPRHSPSVQQGASNCSIHYRNPLSLPSYYPATTTTEAGHQTIWPGQSSS